MPHEIAREPNDQGVLITLHGFVRGEEIHDLNEQLMADSSFVQWIYQIWDFSRIEGVDFSMDQMRGFAIQDAAAAEKNPNQKIAIIPRRSDTSGLDNVFHILEDVWGGYESRTLPDVESARAWGCHASK